MQKFIGMAEICEKSKRKPITILRWIASEDFPRPEKIGQTLVWDRQEALEALQKRGVSTRNEVTP